MLNKNPQSCEYKAGNCSKSSIRKSKVLIQDKQTKKKCAEAKPVAISTIKGLIYTLHFTSVHKIATLSKMVLFLLQFYIMSVNPRLKTNKAPCFLSLMMKSECSFWRTQTQKRWIHFSHYGSE